MTGPSQVFKEPLETAVARFPTGGCPSCHPTDSIRELQLCGTVYQLTCGHQSFRWMFLNVNSKRSYSRLSVDNALAAQAKICVLKMSLLFIYLFIYFRSLSGSRIYVICITTQRRQLLYPKMIKALDGSLRACVRVCVCRESVRSLCSCEVCCSLYQRVSCSAV